MEIRAAQIGSAVLAYADAHGDGLGAIAALVGIPLLLWQIFQGARQERARARGRRFAALAALPMTLSGINRWAQQVAASLEGIYPWVMGTDRGQPTPAFAPPQSPDHLIASIEQMIEAAAGDRIAETLAAIVSDIQVLNSRIGDAAVYNSRQLRSHAGMIDNNLFLAARIYARADSLYEASRSLSENAPVDYGRLTAALNIMHIRDRERTAGSIAYPTARQMVEKAYEKQRLRRSTVRKLCDSVAEWRRSRKEEARRDAIAASMARQREERTASRLEDS